MNKLMVACAVACALATCAGAPPRRHVLWDRPHSSLPSWYPPEGPTWIQKVYYTLVSHFGSAVAAGFGTLFGPIGPFVSSFSQPYLSTYVSRLTGDVVARSLSDAPAPLTDNALPSGLWKPFSDEESSQKTTRSLQDQTVNYIRHVKLTDSPKDSKSALLKDRLYEDFGDDLDVSYRGHRASDDVTNSDNAVNKH